ncbi:MAG: hypothetical protein RLZZ169_973, partial [Pseudomonadota bacterium]
CLMDVKAGRRGFGNTDGTLIEVYWQRQRRRPLMHSLQRNFTLLMIALCCVGVGLIVLSMSIASAVGY